MTTLAETLTQIFESGKAKRDPAVSEVMDRTTADLVASDILESLPKVGDPAPIFARPNLENKTVRLSSALRSGPGRRRR